MPIRIADLAAECGFSHEDFIANPKGWPWHLTKGQRARFLNPNAVVEDSEVNELRMRFSGGINWFPPNRHVTQWSVQQFKAFNERQTLPLRSINLIVGPNGSGKSSVLQSFLWAHHGFQTGELDVHLPKLASDSVDLGGFDSTVFRHAPHGKLTFSFDIHPRVLEEQIELRMPMTITVSICGLDIGHRSLLSKRRKSTAPQESGARSEVVSLRFESAGRAFLEASRQMGAEALAITSCDLSHPIFTAMLADIETAEAADDFAQEKLALTRELLGLCLKDHCIEMCGVVPVMEFRSRHVAAHMRTLLNRYEPRLRRSLSKWRRLMVQRFPNFIRSFSTNVLGAVGVYLESIRYVGPAHQSMAEVAVGTEKISILDLLRDDAEIRAAVNEHLTRLQINFQLGVKRIKRHGMALQIHDIQNQTVVAPSAAGSSFNQIVYFLVTILLCTKREAHKTILIEGAFQQVHPALQAEMGDVFIRNALGENQNQFIMETHSEHLILRLLRRIRQSTENDPSYPAGLPRIRPEDVSVTYTEPTKNGTKLRELRISPSGQFYDDWPQGFFTERLRELL